MTQKTPIINPNPLDMVQVQAVQLGLFTKLGQLIAEVQELCQETVPDNPMLPHILMVTALANTLGQIVSLVPQDQQHPLVSHAMRQMIDQFQAQTALKNGNVMGTVGHA